MVFSLGVNCLDAVWLFAYAVFETDTSPLANGKEFQSNAKRF